MHVLTSFVVYVCATSCRHPLHNNSADDDGPANTRNDQVLRQPTILLMHQSDGGKTNTKSACASADFLSLLGASVNAQALKRQMIVTVGRQHIAIRIVCVFVCVYMCVCVFFMHYTYIWFICLLQDNREFVLVGLFIMCVCVCVCESVVDVPPVDDYTCL